MNTSDAWGSAAHIKRKGTLLSYATSFGSVFKMLAHRWTGSNSASRFNRSSAGILLDFQPS